MRFGYRVREPGYLQGRYLEGTITKGKDGFTASSPLVPRLSCTAETVTGAANAFQDQLRPHFANDPDALVAFRKEAAPC